MRKIAFIVLLAFQSFSGSSQNFLSDRKNLQSLISERASRFSEYTESLKKRSGIFGNKTKRDMEKSNEVLIEIVTTDNKIIDAMNRILDYKAFEKTNRSYNAREFDEKLKQSMMITDTLTSQLTKMESENKKLESKAIKLKGLLYLSFAAILILLFLFLKKRKLVSATEMRKDY